jgi:TPR repeat protein
MTDSRRQATTNRRISAGALVAATLVAAALTAGTFVAALPPPAAHAAEPQGLSARDYIVRAYVLQQRGDAAGAYEALQAAARNAGDRRDKGEALYTLATGELSGRFPGGAAKGWATLEQAAYAGWRPAIRDLAAAQQAGRYRPSDLPRLVKAYEIAASSGSGSIAVLLGDLQRSGALGRPDAAAAERWYAKAAAGDSITGGKRLAVMQAARGDETAALATVARLPAADRPAAYREIATALATGAGVPRNARAAAQWAARGGVVRTARADGRAASGKSRSTGSTKRNETASRRGLPGLDDLATSPEALARLQRAAASGDAAAAARLADAIEAGLAAGSPAEIVTLRITAVGGGRPDVSDGLVRAVGTVAPTDPAAATAVTTLKTAADKGSADAMAALGRLYTSGGPVDADLTVSTDWYRRAAEAGNADAQFRTGMAYSGGVGVPTDPAAARQWLQRAAAAGHLVAKTTLQQLGPDTPGSAAQPPAAPATQ